MTHDVPFLRHVTSNKHRILACFFKFVNFVPIDLKSGKHNDIDWTYNMYLAKKCIDQNNVTYVSMATKYPIIKHMAFFKTLTFFY